ncbi:MAG: AMP-binding protein [Firmicutes bacterium]|nr:AMP-binding protein [Bacillota bacterium]
MFNPPETGAPWLKSYGDVPFHLEYPDRTMFRQLQWTAEQHPEIVAYEFMGRRTTYRQMIEDIRATARAFRAAGIGDGDRVTVCLPNCPQAVLSFYALNMIGALANMVHPLSAEGEIKFYLELSRSKACVTLDQFYPKLMQVRQQTDLPLLIVARVKDALPPLKKLGFSLTMGRKLPKVETSKDTLLWNDFIAGGAAFAGDPEVVHDCHDPAVILYSGGTTGKTKGILLSHLNFNALAYQTIQMDKSYALGDKVLAVMPMFHGFGLGISIHTFLALGGTCLLVPRFTPQTYAKLIIKERPNYIAGVPTLYEALLANEEMADVDLSCLKGVFSGGDSLSVELKKKFDSFLLSHGAKTQIREGYGTTECVTASCLTPYHQSREGSIGVPFPDTYYKIVARGTTDEVPYGEEGEITLTGPTVMLGYLDNPEETAQTLRRHADGKVWLHTGDLGVMDEDGFIYFRQRIKRMIITSGYNVYPSQLENIFDAHEKVLMSCIIGVPDPLKIEKVKAFVQLMPGVPQTAATREELMEYARRHIARYALPYDIEFRDSLPRTLVGKVAYRQLEEEEAERRRQAAPGEPVPEQAAAAVAGTADAR